MKNNFDNISQRKLFEKKDEFIESLNLTPEKIREDLENMRDIEGFPIGDVEDILELSDPPYYTAYPNPYIKDFIEYYGTPYDEESDDYDISEPYVDDVSEGKNDPIYGLHSYHTKVPPKAIMKYIEHYTKKEDIVFDGFCGSGMTGIACQNLKRNAILTDIAPIASFISYNYNHSINADKSYNKIKNIYNIVKNDYGWVYKTKHQSKEGIINYVVWSDVYICPSCNAKFDFYSAGVDEENHKVLKEYSCPFCKIKLTNRTVIKDYIEYEDNWKKFRDVHSVPVLIDYTFNKKKFRKVPDENDLELIKKIQKLNIPFWNPINPIPNGYNTNQPKESHGIKYMNQFYTKRNYLILSAIFNKIINEKDKILRFLFFSFMHNNTNRRNRFIVDKYRPKGSPAGPLSNTLYFPNLQTEMNIFNSFLRAINKFNKVKNIWTKKNQLISNQSSTNLLNIPSNSVDYIFVDPPFGQNIMYSEMNLIWESWLRIFTNNKSEAIINPVQNKFLYEYEELMTKCFNEFFRILKPNRWMSVEFHNSKMEVWKSIQNSLIASGFVIAQVAILDKKHGTIYQDRKINSVKNDLVISTYKPASSFTSSFLRKHGKNMEKKFIKTHLAKLPIKNNSERTQQMLYSKLIAQYIYNGFEVKMDATDFYKLLEDNFIEINGFWFNENQIATYEKQRNLLEKINENEFNQKILGIYDEKSAIIWLSQFLSKPKDYDEIFVEFSKNLMTSIDKIPELKIILDDNVILDDGKYRLPSSIEKQEKGEIRKKRLLKEYNEILENIQKSKNKIKELRKEALLYGLMKLYNEKDIDTIKLIADRIDRKIIDSDEDISTIIDWAMYK